ncbi:DUF3000 domain-containing protein [Allokutzneria multivorans]|uniref:DUF3000 domain-containing protein n=1 Tax=Allokutzneria multivorans TaxID=1142134 RepID=A0ABP7TEH3_9PSEU
MTGISAEPEVFREAVAALRSVQPRPEMDVSEVKAPQRLAPWAYALSAEVDGPAGELATGRLVLLHDPDGAQAWDGVLRLVVLVRAELDTELAGDPLLPEVGWSWLTDALETSGAEWTALGGTVTQTSSARFGDIAGPTHTHDLELRGSWTALDTRLASHGQAFCELLASAAGLPPAGVTLFGQRKANC